MVNKSKPRRRRGRIIKGKFQDLITLGTLAASTGIRSLLVDVADEKVFALSVEMTATKRGGTDGEGPIDLFVAHSDYSLAEIEEYIENSASWSSGDLLAQEVGKRKVRKLGTFSGVGLSQSLNDGMEFKTPLKFTINSGQTLVMVAYNRSGNTLTTGSIIDMDGHVWLKPI